MKFFSRLIGGAPAEPAPNRQQARPQPSSAPQTPPQTQIDDANAAAVLSAELYAAQRYAEALPLAEWAATMFAQTLGTDHPHVAQMRVNQAAILWKLERFADAEQAYKLALAAREKSLGRDHPETADLHFSIGSFYEQQRRFAEAEEHFARALAAREKTLGPAHIQCSMLLFALGRMNFVQGRYWDAEKLLRRAVPIEEAIHGPDDKNVGAVLSMLAVALLRTERPLEAESLYKRVLTIYTAKLGAEHPATVDIRERLAEISSSYPFRSEDELAAVAVKSFIYWLGYCHHRKGYASIADAVEFWLRYDAGKGLMASRYGAFLVFCRKLLDDPAYADGIPVRLDANSMATVPRGGAGVPLFNQATFDAATKFGD